MIIFSHPSDGDALRFAAADIGKSCYLAWVYYRRGLTCRFILIATGMVALIAHALDQQAPKVVDSAPGGAAYFSNPSIANAVQKSLSPGPPFTAAAESKFRNTLIASKARA